MARKQTNYYFERFIALMEYAIQAAKYLEDSVHDFHSEELSKRLQQMHEIEHKADLEKHVVMEKLIKEFITPIEREDIVTMLQTIDNVTDAIEDVLRHAYMYNVTKVSADIVKFTEIIAQCCDVTRQALSECEDLHHAAMIHQHVVRVNELEEQGDRLHSEAIRHLYTECDDPMEVIKFTRMLDCCEECCDACEDVTDVIESILMKNS